MKRIIYPVFLFISTFTWAQKKQLDHTVYDRWERIGEKLISPNGEWAVYTVEPQEGDGTLFVQSLNTKEAQAFPRGAVPQFSFSGRYLVFKVKPFYTQIREARIKKKKPEEFPKDSLVIVEVGKGEVKRIPMVKSFKMPAEEDGLLVVHQESVEKSTEANETPAPLVIVNLNLGTETTIQRVTEYEVAQKGGSVIAEQARNQKDSLTKTLLLLINATTKQHDTIATGGNDFRSFTFSEDGTRLAFLAERDARPKELIKYYKLFLFRAMDDTARQIVDRNTMGMRLGYTVSEFGKPRFSKSGSRLYFGAAPIKSAADTSLPEIDQVKVDVWHYNDDYLQTQQLFNLKRDLERNYLAVFDLHDLTLMHLESEKISQVITTAEGDGETAFGISDWGYRIETQWKGVSKKDIYKIDVATGDTTLIKKGLDGVVYSSFVSPNGDAIIWYDYALKQYVSWYKGKTQVISRQIPFALYDEEHDSPSPPDPYGIAGFEVGDSAVWIYDRFDAWQVALNGQKKPRNITLQGRVKKENLRYVRVDAKEKYVAEKGWSLWRFQQQQDKSAGLALAKWSDQNLRWQKQKRGPYTYGNPVQSKTSPVILYTKESYALSPDLHVWQFGAQIDSETKLSSTNPQQQQYNWGTSSIYKWKAIDGKNAQGVLYLPENFDPKKKYPLLLYFYETHTNTLHSYIPPSPTGSRLNISFYVSRGYVVLSPDIHYQIGYPAKSCYNYVVSAAQQLAKEPWIDAANMGIQGQSWGGIQVAQLVTMTSIFKAAWAGAPVANMTSAYGGIRWESGVNRQFQYEMSQSRIGATLWQRRDLYLENSPLFKVPQIKTPLVIMANDADGAVPWYQGVELFTAMRRLGKKVWMLNYNGEAHNLRERKNQKDISIRQQQYFDWLLKGERPARWITEGVPAVNKGKDWGLDLVD